MQPGQCAPCLPPSVIVNVPGQQGLVGPDGPQGPPGSLATLNTYAAYGNSTSAAYTLANSSGANSAQLLNLSPTAPSIVLGAAGTYLLFARARFDITGATLTTQTLTTKTRCINNTVGDVANTTRTFAVQPTTTITGTLAEITWPTVAYVTTNSGDNLQLWGVFSAETGAGTVTCVDADIIAVKIA